MATCETNTQWDIGYVSTSENLYIDFFFFLWPWLGHRCNQTNGIGIISLSFCSCNGFEEHFCFNLKKQSQMNKKHSRSFVSNSIQSRQKVLHTKLQILKKKETQSQCKWNKHYMFYTMKNSMFYKIEIIIYIRWMQYF